MIEHGVRSTPTHRTGPQTEYNEKNTDSLLREIAMTIKKAHFVDNVGEKRAQRGASISKKKKERRI